MSDYCDEFGRVWIEDWNDFDYREALSEIDCMDFENRTLKTKRHPYED